MRRRSVIALLVVAALGVMWVRHGSGSPEAPVSAPATATTTAAAPTPTESTIDPTPTRSGADAPITTGPDRAWTATAEQFLTAYTAAATTPRDAWLAKVRALTTDHLAAGLAYTDPDRVPTGQVTESHVLSDYDTGGGVIRVRLSSGPILLVTVVTDTGGKALVGNIEEQR